MPAAALLCSLSSCRARPYPFYSSTAPLLAQAQLVGDEQMRDARNYDAARGQVQVDACRAQEAQIFRRLEDVQRARDAEHELHLPPGSGSGSSQCHSSRQCSSSRHCLSSRHRCSRRRRQGRAGASGAGRARGGCGRRRMTMPGEPGRHSAVTRPGRQSSRRRAVQALSPALPPTLPPALLPPPPLHSSGGPQSGPSPQCTPIP